MNEIDTPTAPRFSLGQSIVATPAAIDLLARHQLNAAFFLERHAVGDWGDLCPEDRQANDRALKDGSRLFSVYHVGQEKLWIITEAASSTSAGRPERACTCLLTPGDY